MVTVTLQSPPCLPQAAVQRAAAVGPGHGAGGGACGGRGEPLGCVPPRASNAWCRSVLVSHAPLHLGLRLQPSLHLPARPCSRLLVPGRLVPLLGLPQSEAFWRWLLSQ